jgi:hypothetical protein
MSTTARRPGVLHAGVHQLADLRERERGRHRGPDRGAERHAGVGREAGGDVDGEDRGLARVDRVDDRRREPLDGCVEAGAEERVHHDRGTPEARPQPVERGVGQLVRRAPRALPRGEGARGVPAHVLGTPEEPHLDRHARALEMSRDDEAVTTVVAAPGDDHDGLRAAAAAGRAAPSSRRPRRAP